MTRHAVRSRLTSAALLLCLALAGGASAQVSGSREPGMGCAGQVGLGFGISKSRPINTTANAVIIPGIAGLTTFVCHVHMVAAGAVNATIVEGTGATCGTGTARMFAGSTAATGWNFTANALTLTLGDGAHVIAVAGAALGDDVCILVSAAVQVSGAIIFVQF
jgi:hypothetical protein